MAEIVPPRITIDEFKVNSLNLSKKFVEFSFGYNVLLKNFRNRDKINRKFSFDENIVNFVMAAFADIKKTTGTEMALIEKEEEMKEKIVNIITRLLQEIKDLAKIKDHERYMRAFNRINCYKVSFPDIIV